MTRRLWCIIVVSLLPSSLNCIKISVVAVPIARGHIFRCKDCQNPGESTDPAVIAVLVNVAVKYSKFHHEIHHSSTKHMILLQVGQRMLEDLGQ